MTKAKRQMQENLKLIDLVIELLDARIPLSSRNPDIDKLAQGKARLIILNKADLADDKVTASWMEFFSKKGINVCKVNCKNNSELKQINAAITQACADKRERDKNRGIKPRPIRAMVVGIPNVGKSTFINVYAKRSVAQTGNKPGVTKGTQWIKLGSQTELLDTPGILWPKFEDQSVGLKLALIGSIRDEIMNVEELALELLKLMESRYPGVISSYYGTDSVDVEKQMDEIRAWGNEPALEVEQLYKIAKAKSCLKPGGIPDTEKAARLLLENFRNGRIGVFSLEAPDNK